jgi:hypothetical protein
VILCVLATLKMNSSLRGRNVRHQQAGSSLVALGSKGASIDMTLDII